MFQIDVYLLNKKTGKSEWTFYKEANRRNRLIKILEEDQEILQGHQCRILLDDMMMCFYRPSDYALKRIKETLEHRIEYVRKTMGCYTKHNKVKVKEFSTQQRRV